MGEYQALFKFAAKAGSLEGYLYERENLEPLQNWVSNIGDMYLGLPEQVKAEIRNELGNVLRRTLTYGEKVLDDEIKAKLNNLLLAL